jgi:hypothetical protein
MVVPTVLTMARDLAHYLGKFVVIGKDSASVTVTP